MHEYITKFEYEDLKNGGTKIKKIDTEYNTFTMEEKDKYGNRVKWSNMSADYEYYDNGNIKRFIGYNGSETEYDEKGRMISNKYSIFERRNEYIDDIKNNRTLKKSFTDNKLESESKTIFFRGFENKDNYIELVRSDDTFENDDFTLQFKLDNGNIRKVERVDQYTINDKIYDSKGNCIHTREYELVEETYDYSNNK